MSIPTTSAPKRAKGTAVVPSPQPRSKTRSGVVTPRDLTSASPDSRINAAIFVKSPFSHSALFRFIVESFHLTHLSSVLSNQSQAAGENQCRRPDSIQIDPGLPQESQP